MLAASSGDTVETGHTITKPIQITELGDNEYSSISGCLVSSSFYEADSTSEYVRCATTYILMIPSHISTTVNTSQKLMQSRIAANANLQFK